MHFKSIILTLLAGFLFTPGSFGQPTKPIEYLGVPGPILFGKVSYNLVWTSHPGDNYYKQEYLAKGDTIGKFKKLILVELLTDKATIEEVVVAKIVELNRIKETNPVVNYETFEKDGEVILDFLLSENTPDGKYMNIVERNVYRYKSFDGKKGIKGILLFGVSERAYGDEIDKFFPELKTKRFDLINAVGAFKIPEITITK
jgi:hypothetical protein